MGPWIFVTLAAIAALAGALYLIYGRVPRSDRDWTAEHAVPARISVANGEARIERLRDFRPRPGGGVAQGYRDETIRLDDVRGAWLVIAPFARVFRGLAHVFLSFELEEGRFISISVEARRRRGQSYSVVGGLFRRFEVTYVVGTETDLLGGRAAGGDRILLYPLKATPEQARSLFADMLAGAEARRRVPAFYNSLAHNCATVLREHVNRALPARLPFGVAVFLPGYADGVALAHGLLDTDLPIEAARERFRVDERARVALAEGAEADFSLRIRRPSPTLAAEPRSAPRP
jgi:hypothetical protein